MERTALVTAVGSTTGQSVIKGLRRGCPGLRIVGVDIYRDWNAAGSTMVDRFVRVPAASDPGYVDALCGVCSDMQVAAVFPVFDAELTVLSHRHRRFEELGVRLWLSDPQAVEMANDKWRTHLFFRELGIDSPDTWLPERLPTPLPGFPLVVKPRVGVSSRDVFVVDDEHELHRAVDRVEQPIVQEWLDGREVTVDVTTDRDGRILGVVPRLRVEVRSGLCYKGLTLDAPEIADAAIRIAGAMGLRGPANVQCRVHRDRIRFFEINPRFSGSLPLSIEAGVNSPAMLWRSTLGESVERAVPETGIYMTRHWQEVYRHGISADEL